MRGRIGLVVAAVMVVAVLVAARLHRPDDAPYLPRDDKEVLEHLAAGAGADPAADSLRGLEAQLARAPGDLSLASRVARTHIEAARATGDARRLSYAEAALQPFWDRADPPAQALLLRAIIEQSRHDFARALSDLDRLVEKENDPQAWLTRASVLAVLSRWDDAKKSCEHLRGIATPIVEATCVAQAEAATGHSDASRVRLLALAAAPGIDKATRAWAHSVSGESALYAGETEAAIASLTSSIEDDPTDVYSKGLLADALLDAGRAPEVLALIGADEPNEILLLRRAIAAARTNAPDAAALASRLRARDAELRARGDGSHRREEARRLLALDHDAAGALAAAKLDFEQQREPWDARVLVEAARAANDPASAAPAREWIQKSGCRWPPLVKP